jgi:hypothetical protein
VASAYANIGYTPPRLFDAIETAVDVRMDSMSARTLANTVRLPQLVTRKLKQLRCGSNTKLVTSVLEPARRTAAPLRLGTEARAGGLERHLYWTFTVALFHLGHSICRAAPSVAALLLERHTDAV